MLYKEESNFKPAEREKNISEIFTFEFLGTLLFAYGIVCSRGSDIFISCFLFAGICISVEFSDGHVNPAITLAFWENGSLSFARA